MENRMMLDLRADDVPAFRLLRLGDAADGEVIGLGSATQENNFPGFRVDQFCDVLTRVVDQ